MKKATLQFSYDEEKLNAIKLFLEKKNSSMDAEVKSFLNGLYRKVVPVNVRSYLSMKDSPGQGSEQKPK